MENIKRFMNGDIGLSIPMSTDEDIAMLSDIVAQNYDMSRVRRGNLADFCSWLKRNVTEKPWSLVVWSPTFGDFIGYRGSAVDNYLLSHTIRNAAGIMETTSKNIDIAETELEDILCS